MAITIPDGFDACAQETTGPGGVVVWTLCFAPAGCSNPMSDPSAIKIVMSGNSYDSLNAYISGK